jgi:multisubunit Na+/H+ antiporter MnhC subunit
MEYKEIINTILKTSTLLITIFSLIIIIAILIFVRKNKYKWLIWFYMPSMLTSLIFLSVGLFGNELILHLLEDKINEYQNFVAPFITNICLIFTIYGIVLLVLSILAFVIYQIFKKKEDACSNSKVNATFKS